MKMPRGDKPTTPALALKDGWVYEDTLPASITKEQYDWWYKESLVLDGVRMGPPLTTLEPGAGGHVHRFNAVRVPPEFGHSYLRCAYCGLSKHLESHDASTCELCTRVPASAAPVVDKTVYADGFCARCSELTYPLTRALEKTGVPTGADNWQQTYGPNKVRALADLETCLRRLLFALEEGKPEDIKERIQRANHYIEFHAEVRRRLTALAQERNADSAAATVGPVGQSDELVDEVQHRMDQVVEAAVEWHQAGREGAEWLEAAEKLGAAIDSLLELRDKPSQMPRRWCSVHNREEFKHESLEHELRATAAATAAHQLNELQEAYNQGIEDAKCAIRAESQGGGYWAATYINAIARRCSPFGYTGLPPDADEATREQIVQAITDIQEARESHAQWANHLRNEKHALCAGCDDFAAHIGNAEYHDEWIAKYDNVISVLARVPFTAAPVEQSED